MKYFFITLLKKIYINEMFLYYSLCFSLKTTIFVFILRIYLLIKLLLKDE